jgi:hypothetical protein
MIACLLAGIAAVVLLAPATASAGCGGTEVAKPRKQVNPKGQAPLVLGDSVMLLALRSLARIGYLADAKGCRYYTQGINRIKHYKHEGKLGHLVVMGFGADYNVTKHYIDRTLRIIGPKRVLALIVPRELGGGTSSDADHVRAAYHRHTGRIMLLDWVGYSKGHGEWFQPDGLHLTYSGAAAYTKLIGKSLRYAVAGVFPDHAHFPR